ncbi:MAG: lytic transglycosylase domain-containing protein [Defluviimonas sp.]|uniref:lytic transglycosylase domain-containing protein n=1 Tax=Albidovulum sp. TaxID=1872424 RepID=UPI001DE5C0A2|nr:lytic transglycosylase domain-containing protein [Paracoccaceae bacterium]MCC0065031.1 lytic transglycosylase domain-containing protein [Defluviimonas sp.]
MTGAWAAGAAAVLVVAAAGPAGAEGLSFGAGASRADRLSQFRQQLSVLDSRASTQYAASVKLTPHGKAAATAVLPSYAGNYRGHYLQPAREAARRHGVPEDLFLRLVQRESGWNPQAVSHRGATGLAQLMPATAARLGVDLADPHANLDGGARYLRMMFDRFGDWRLALAAYNAGPEAVERYGGVPPYAETKGYVVAILGG